MSLFKRFAYLLSTISFMMFSFIASSPLAHANSYPGGNGKLTFYSPVSEGTTQEVYTINPDGTGLQQVTNNSIPDANPQWSPCLAAESSCAVAIAFDSNPNDTQKHDIYVQTFTDNGSIIQPPVPLVGADTTGDEYDPSWNPAGTTIAFHKGAGSDYDIYTITGFDSTFDNGTVTQRTNGGTEIRDTEPTWSKGGDYLTFTRQDRASSPSISGCDWTSGSPAVGGCIAVLPAGGTESDVVYIDSTTTATIGSPQWSPVANKVVYMKDGNVTIADLGSAMQNLNSPTITTLVTSGGGAAPTWSPDGKIIATSGASGMYFYDAVTGALIHSVAIADVSALAQTGIHELDWARAASPENTVHECTTTVNVPCSDGDFSPNIPDACSTGLQSTISTTAQHGEPGYADGNFTFTPTVDYVGTDQYIYTYYDQYMNSITCTVNITVLPNAPDTGVKQNISPVLVGVLSATILASGALVRKRMYHR